MLPPLGILEVRGLTMSMLALDALDKTANCRVINSELNDLGGICLKATGTVGDLEAGLAAAKRLVERFNGECLTHVIASPSKTAWPAIEGGPEYTPLMECNIVFFPDYESVSPQGGAGQSKRSKTGESAVSESKNNLAIGFIETQGYTAVIEAIDTACKSGNVEVLGREKLGGGYITVVIQGDVAAVEAAVEAGKDRVGALGVLIAGHVIARPSEGVRALLPKE